MTATHYNPWPLGKLPEHFQRPEPGLVRELGVDWDDPREINQEFESRLARHSGSRYAVLTDCCTNAISLCLNYSLQVGRLAPQDTLEIPTRTYVSVPMAIHHAGLRFRLREYAWTGEYEIGVSGIYDSAARFTKDSFGSGALAKCLSFQIKKRLPIGRGGAILTNNKQLYEWAKLAVYDGRDLKTKYDSADHVRSLGWHYYMTPEDAARGIILMAQLPEINPDMMDHSHYPDLRNWAAVASLEAGD